MSVYSEYVLANKWAHTTGIDDEAYFAAVREVLKLCGVKTLSREQRKNTKIMTEASQSQIRLWTEKFPLSRGSSLQHFTSVFKKFKF